MMIDLLRDVLDVSLLMLGIVIVWVVIVALVIGVRQAVAQQRKK